LEKQPKKSMAIMITGQVRTIDECFPSLVKHFINPNKEEYDFKVFMLLQRNNNRYNNRIYEDATVPAYPYAYFDVTTDPELPNLVYQDKRYALNKKVPPKYDLRMLKHPIYCFYLLYWINEVNVIRKEYEKRHNIAFDYMARVRPDMLFQEDLDLSSIKDDTVYLPYTACFGGYNDRFAFGGRGVMDVYMQRYSFWMKRHDRMPGYTTHAETNLKLYLDNHDINVKRMRFRHMCPYFGIPVKMNKTGYYLLKSIGESIRRHSPRIYESQIRPACLNRLKKTLGSRSVGSAK
jgi:hypothetical protein